MAEPGAGGLRPRSMKRVLLEVPLFLGLVVALFLVAPAPVAHACSCAMRGTQQQVEGADVVVRGTITGLRDPGGASSGRLMTYEVAVAEVFKGKSTATTSLRSAAWGGPVGSRCRRGSSTSSSPDGSGVTCGPDCVTGPDPCLTSS